jgi:phage protein D
MISKQAVGLSPTLNISINGVPVDYLAINEVEMSLEVNMHDMLMIRLSGIPPRALLEYRNRPVFCSMDLGAGYYQEFFGYVIDTQVTNIASGGTVNGSPFQDARLICLGTSYEMRGGTSRVWKHRKLSDVVLSFALKYKFSAAIPFDPIVLDPMLQDNESDWQFVIKYATTLGYDTTMHGTHLHVFDPYKAYSRRISYNRLRTSKQIRAGVAAQPGQIANISVTMGEHHPDGVYKDTTITVHQDDNTVYEVSLGKLKGLTKPARFSNRLRDSVDTYQQAKRAIDVESKATYDYTADLVVMGIPGCKPGGIVEIDSYDTDETDGLWYVQSVKHKLHSSAFLTELRVVRNINSELVPASVQSLARPPSSQLVSDQWVPVKRTTDVYT